MQPNALNISIKRQKNYKNEDVRLQWEVHGAGTDARVTQNKQTVV